MEPETSQKSLLPLGIVVVVLVLAGGIYWVSSRNAQEESTSPTPNSTASSTSTVSPTPPPPPTPTPTVKPGTSLSPTPTSIAVKVFTVSASNFSFSPKEMRVKKGEKVKIVLTNIGGTHDLVLDAFNVRTPQIGDGKTATIEFTADKTGTFEYYCSVGSHRALGMKGNLIVE